MNTTRPLRFTFPATPKAGVWLAVALLATSTAGNALACPFCGVVQQTLTEELTAAKTVVFASLVKPIPDIDDLADDELPADELPDGPLSEAPNAGTALFRVTEVLRGGEQVSVDQEIDVVYFGQDGPDQRFLITSLASDRLDWSTPIPVSESAMDYVRQLQEIPAEGPGRLEFFQQYFEHEDPLLAQDSYDEFARAPYSVIVELGPKLPREKLLRWIEDPEVGPTHRRLYLTLLGVCGKPDDVEMLERLLNFDRQLIDPGVLTVVGAMGAVGNTLGVGVLDELVRAEEQRKKQSLDALIACFLKLKGPEGLPLVNRLFLANPHVEYTHLHAALMALRFHGEEADVLPRSDLLQSMRLALDHPDFADQVVPDLARWGDWDVMPRLVTMFKDATSDSWIRQPVVSFLLVAAEEEGEVGADAKAALAELEAIDKETVDRARSNAAFSLLALGKSRGKPADAAASDSLADSSAADGSGTAADGATPATETESSAESTTAKDDEATAQAEKASSGLVSTVETSPTSRTISRYTLLGIVLLASLAMLAIFAVLIRGSDPRLSHQGSAPDQSDEEI